MEKYSTIKTKKGKVEISFNHNYDIKGFRCLESGHLDSQCLNKKIVVIRKHGKIESKSDKSEEDEMLPLEDYSNVKYLVEEKTLVINRSLNVQIKKDDIKQ